MQGTENAPISVMCTQAERRLVGLDPTGREATVGLASLYKVEVSEENGLHVAEVQFTDVARLLQRILESIKAAQVPVLKELVAMQADIASQLLAKHVESEHTIQDCIDSSGDLVDCCQQTAKTLEERRKLIERCLKTICTCRVPFGPPTDDSSKSGDQTTSVTYVVAFLRAVQHERTSLDQPLEQAARSLLQRAAAEGSDGGPLVLGRDWQSRASLSLVGLEPSRLVAAEAHSAAQPDDPLDTEASQAPDHPTTRARDEATASSGAQCTQAEPTWAQGLSLDGRAWAIPAPAMHFDEARATTGPATASSSASSTGSAPSTSQTEPPTSEPGSMTVRVQLDDLDAFDELAETGCTVVRRALAGDSRDVQAGEGQLEEHLVAASSSAGTSEAGLQVAAPGSAVLFRYRIAVWDGASSSATPVSSACAAALRLPSNEGSRIQSGLPSMGGLGGSTRSLMSSGSRGGIAPRVQGATHDVLPSPAPATADAGSASTTTSGASSGPASGVEVSLPPAAAAGALLQVCSRWDSEAGRVLRDGGVARALGGHVPGAGDEEVPELRVRTEAQPMSGVALAVGGAGSVGGAGHGGPGVTIAGAAPGIDALPLPLPSGLLTALQLVPVGHSATAILAPSQAFGARGFGGSIPPDSHVVVDLAVDGVWRGVPAFAGIDQCAPTQEGGETTQVSASASGSTVAAGDALAGASSASRDPARSAPSSTRAVSDSKHTADAATAAKAAAPRYSLVSSDLRNQVLGSLRARAEGPAIDALVGLPAAS